MNAAEIKTLRSEIGMLVSGVGPFSTRSRYSKMSCSPLKMFTRQSGCRAGKAGPVSASSASTLSGADKQYPSEISGGMQKRVAIARAIALNPRYLFCDEPNSGLDPQTSILIDELIRDITREYNITTIINTHDMSSVLGIGENIIFLNQGQKEWVGNKDDLFTSTNEKLNNFVFASKSLQNRKKIYRPFSDKKSK